MTTPSHLFDADSYLTSPRTPSLLSRINPNLGFYAPHALDCAQGWL